jgi:hypothetical protein
VRPLCLVRSDTRRCLSPDRVQTRLRCCCVASAPAAAGSAIAFGDALAPRYGSDLLSLKSSFLFAAGRPPFLVLPGSGGFAEFASSARSASPLNPLRAPIANPEPCGGVGPPSPWETRWFAVTTAPVLRARRSLQGRYFPADLTSPAAVSRKRRALSATGDRLSLSHGETVRPVPGESVTIASGMVVRGFTATNRLRSRDTS